MYKGRCASRGSLVTPAALLVVPGQSLYSCLIARRVYTDVYTERC
jgi:hypothetical protein